MSLKERIEEKIEYLKSLNTECDMVKGQLIGLIWVYQMMEYEETEHQQMKNKRAKKLIRDKEDK